MFFGFAFLFHVIKKKLKGPGPSSARMTFYRYLAGTREREDSRRNPRGPGISGMPFLGARFV